MDAENIILKVNNLSKQYKLGLIGSGTIRDDLKRWWYNIRGKEDPFLTVGDTNDPFEKGESDYVWALQGIDFEVQEGEVLGIIGKNGAGKSTLLKILSRVTSPTTGYIKTKGRIASLLEVGTGFHPELTGRENIYLNGAILGMTKVEIQTKEDEIISFSGCDRYIDTPVKRYSSGMRVRLAFAVAAHLEPDILVIDEVLAVGDAEFQKKAIGKMQDISKGDGRTVLFVSHNMAAVKSLCTRGIVLEHGKVAFEGNTDAAVDYYLNLDVEEEQEHSGIVTFIDDDVGNEEVTLFEVSATDVLGRIRNNYFNNEDICITLKIQVKKSIKDSRFALIVKTTSNEIVFVSSSFDQTNVEIKKGIYNLDVIIPKNLLNSSNYKIAVSGALPGKNYFFKPKDCFLIQIVELQNKGYGFNENWPGTVHPILKWSLKK